MDRLPELDGFRKRIRSDILPPAGAKRRSLESTLGCGAGWRGNPWSMRLLRPAAVVAMMVAFVAGTTAAYHNRDAIRNALSGSGGQNRKAKERNQKPKRPRLERPAGTGEAAAGVVDSARPGGEPGSVHRQLVPSRDAPRHRRHQATRATETRARTRAAAQTGPRLDGTLGPDVPAPPSQPQYDLAARPPSALSRQVSFYELGLKLRQRNARLALQHWKAFKARWPDSPLAHEVDLQLLKTLLQLDRVDEARSLARRIVKQYPNSPKIEAVRDIATSDGDSVEKVSR